MPAYSLSSTQQKVCVLFDGDLQIMRILYLTVADVEHFQNANSRAHFSLPYFHVGKMSDFNVPNIFSSMITVTIQVTYTLQAMKQWNLYFSFLMVFAGQESANSFLTLFRMGGGEDAKRSLTSFPQHFLNFSFNLFAILL